jgi:putative ABC transport system permease protein
MRSLTLVRKNLFRRKLRFGLLFFSIMVAFLLYGALASIDSLLNGGSDVGLDNRMMTTNKINFTQPVPISYLSRIRAIKGVTAASHRSWFGGYFQDPKNQMVMFATEPESYLKVYPELVIDVATKERFIRDRTGVLVGKPIADKFGWRVGQKVPIFSNIFQQKNGSRSWDFTIAGIFTVSKDNQTANFALFNWEYFNETRSFWKDMTGTVVFLTENAKINDSVKVKVDNLFTNSQYATETSTERAFFAAFAGQLGNIGLLIKIVVGASFITILIIVGNTMVMAVRERTREIGIMKTLGFSVQKIMAMIVGESLAIALIGGLAGIALAAILFKVLAVSTGMGGGSIPGIIWFKGVGWMIFLGILTSAIPAYNALKLNIVTALGRN